MATVATAHLKKLAQDWKTQCGLSSATISGIVGDLAHKARGGYHISREDQPSGNFSVTRPDDRPGNGRNDAASAIDMNFNTKDMVTQTRRLVQMYDNLSDPRRKYLNAFNGTLDNKNALRWDVYARKISASTKDHLWHVHLSIRRKYTESDTAMKAILSVLKGESVEQYLKSIGVSVKAAPKTPPSYPGRILKRNDAQTSPDPSVRAVQTQLLARGWKSVGSADGFFGPRLEADVKKWQAYVGLPADGMIGPKTWPTFWTKPMAG